MKAKWAASFILSLFNVLHAHVLAQLNIDSLRHIIVTSSNEQELAGAYNHYAYQLYRKQPDTAISYGQKALALSLQINNENEINSAYNLLGLSYQSKGLYRLSLANLSKALQYDKKDTADRAKTLHNTALIHRSMKNNSDALKYELEAIQLLQSHKDSLTLGIVYETISTLYRDMEDYKQAEEYIVKAIAIMKSLTNFGANNGTSLLANTYTSYGNLLQTMGNLNGAISKHKQGIQIHNLSGDVYNLAIGYENLATDYLLAKKYNAAITNYKTAESLMRRLNSAADIGYELYNIARVFQATGKLGKVLLFADSALSLFAESGADAFRLDAYKLKYEVYDSMNNISDALAFYKKYNALKDSLNMEAQKEELVRLKTDYETAQKEQQIKLLTTANKLKEKERLQQILLRNIAIGAIAVLLVAGLLLRNRYTLKQRLKETEMRNKIASDLHDDVGSTLSSIRMYSDIVKAQPNQTETSTQLLGKISSNSKEMIENMSDIVWMIKPGNDDFSNIENRMLNFANELCVPADINFEFTKEISTDAKQIPMELRRDIYLIFKEAINNAVKYAGCHCIHAGLNLKNHQLQVYVSDDGKGFNTSTISKGNGLSNMQKRTEAHKGIFTIQSSPDKGTEIRIALTI